MEHRPRKKMIRRRRPGAQRERAEYPAHATGRTSATGLLEIDSRGHGFLRRITLTLERSGEDCYVPSRLIHSHALRSGTVIEAAAVPGRGGGLQAAEITTINGLLPDQWKETPEFSMHEVVSPTEWIRLEGPDNDRAMRVIDLFCPLGRGQRALIVSPPKAGKTILLKQLAHAIGANYPDISVVVLLVDERPEEVTDLRRAVRGEVFASSSDTERGDQVRLARLVLEYAKRKVETGEHVVLLLDSLTRLGRAFNIHQKGTGRTLSGGMDARALEIPKRIFGAARKLEDHGSLTIVATALVDTNSRMDELIFQEFKGTGNMELVLDRSLADERIFPAINIGLSGTRREELLWGSALGSHQELRRAVARRSPREAMTAVQKLIDQYPTNEALLSMF